MFVPAISPAGALLLVVVLVGVPLTVVQGLILAALPGIGRVLTFMLSFLFGFGLVALAILFRTDIQGPITLEYFVSLFLVFNFFGGLQVLLWYWASYCDRAWDAMSPQARSGLSEGRDPLQLLTETVREFFSGIKWRRSRRQAADEREFDVPTQSFAKVFFRSTAVYLTCILALLSLFMAIALWLS